MVGAEYLRSRSVSTGSGRSNFVLTRNVLSPRSGQLGAGMADALAGLVEDLAGGRERKAEVPGGSVRRAVDHRHLLRIQQIAGEVPVRADHLAGWGSSAEQCAAVDEQVEAAARGEAGDP